MNNDFYKQLGNEVDKMIVSALEMTPEQIEKEKEYAGLLTKYIQLNKALDKEDYDKIVPRDFKVSKMIDTKIEILKDCIAKKIIIEDSLIYPKIQEGYGGLIK